MHDYFAAWMTPAHAEFTRAMADSRWAGVNALVSTGTPDLFLDLVALVFRAGASDRGVREAIQSGDSSFPMIGAEFELQAMAASALAELFINGKEKGEVAALGTLTARFALGQPTSCPELPSIAEDYLKRRGQEVRETPQINIEALTTADQKAVSGKFDAVVAAVADPATMATAMQEATGALLQVMARLGQSQSRGLRTLEDRQNALDEANDILWWIASDFTGDGQARNAVGARELGVRAGMELAELVRYPVPPTAAVHYFAKVVSLGKAAPKAFRLPTVLANLPSQVRDTMRDGLNGVPEIRRHLLPLHQLAADVSVSPEGDLGPQALAQEVLYERLLATALRQG